MQGCNEAIVNNWLLRSVVEDKQGGGRFVTLTRLELCLAKSNQARPGDLQRPEAGRSRKRQNRRAFF